MRIASWIVFILLVFIEGTVTSFPFIPIFLLCLMVMKRAEWVFLLALIAGVMLDFLSLRPIGMSSILLILFAFTILLYERKYEIATIPFVFFASLVGSFLYLYFLRYPSIVESLVSSIFAVIVFIIYQFIHRPGVPTHLDYQKV